MKSRNRRHMVLGLVILMVLAGSLGMLGCGGGGGGGEVMMRPRMTPPMGQMTTMGYRWM